MDDWSLYSACDGVQGCGCLPLLVPPCMQFIVNVDAAAEAAQKAASGDGDGTHWVSLFDDDDNDDDNGGEGSSGPNAAATAASDDDVAADDAAWFGVTLPTVQPPPPPPVPLPAIADTTSWRVFCFGDVKEGRARATTAAGAGNEALAVASSTAAASDDDGDGDGDDGGDGDGDGDGDVGDGDAGEGGVDSVGAAGGGPAVGSKRPRSSSDPRVVPQLGVSHDSGVAVVATVDGLADTPTLTRSGRRNGVAQSMCLALGLQPTSQAQSRHT